MANLPESSSFDAGVYQIETSDPVLGGPSGVTNTPLKNLANRTRYLKDHVGSLESGATVPPGIATEAWTTGELQKRDMKASVRCATTANISLSGLQTIDGVALSAGDRVLARAQSAGQDNGIYVAASGAWTRAADANTSEKVSPGMLVYVESGTTQADIIYKLTTDAPVTLGSSVLGFANILAGYATLASPALSGDPTAPTPAQFDNDTSLATTEFVQRALGNLRGAVNLSVNTTLTEAHVGQLLAVSASNLTITLPLISAVANGASFLFYNHHSTPATITRQGSDVISFLDAGGNSLTSFTIPSGKSVMVSRSGALWYVTLNNAHVGLAGQFDSSTLPASTAFVQRALGNLQAAATFTGNQTLTAADAGKMLIYGETVNATVTLPAISGVTAGCSFEFLNTGTANLTVQRAGTDQIDGGASTVTSIVILPGQSLRLVRSSGSSLWHAVTSTALPLASPAFTAPQFDNDTSIATTEFVQRALGNKAGYASYAGNSVALTAADAGKDIYLSFTGAVSVTLPNASTLPAGATFSIVCSSATTANVTVTGGGTFAVPMGAGGASYVVGAATQAEFSGIGSNIYLVKNGAGAASLTANGYQKLPSGLIIQWGTYTEGGQPLAPGTSLVRTVTYPIAFNTVLTSHATTNLNFEIVAGIADGVVSMALSFSSPVGTYNSLNLSCDWLAIGY